MISNNDPENIIQAVDLVQRFALGKNDVTVLKDINLEIDRSEFVALTGPSGSGKSTLLNLVGGLCKPTQGKITVCGQSINHMDESELAVFRRKHIGLVFQSFNLLPNLTAVENVALPLMFAGITVSERKRRAQDILELMGLSDRLNHKPTELSGGQQQRVSIARALINEPILLLADEPTGNLDSKTSAEIMELFMNIKNETGQTCLMVTHDMEAAKYADRTFHLLDGRIERIETSSRD
jgi:putative ABC transport system ATP-binding protein